MTPHPSLEGYKWPSKNYYVSPRNGKRSIQIVFGQISLKIISLQSFSNPQF